MISRLQIFTLTFVALAVCSSSSSIVTSSSSKSDNQTSGPEDPQHYDPKSCNNLPPAIARMEKGVDVISLDLFPSDVGSPGGFKRSIFDFTCKQNRKWEHPSIEGEMFTVPDQIQTVGKSPAGSMNMKTNFNEDIEDVQESMSAKVGLEVEAGFGSFSASVSYKDAKDKMLQTNKSIAETVASILVFDADLRSPKEMPLSSNFRYSVSQLPRRYEDGVEKYQQLLDLFGTHYFDVAKFGGYLYEQTVIENSYLYTTDRREINANLKTSFKMFFGISVDAGAEFEMVDEKSKSSFQQNSELKFFAYGGETDFVNTLKPDEEKDSSYLLNWWGTVVKDPWLIGGQLSPIEKVISDPVIRAEVRKASAVKLTLAALNELKSDCKFIKVSRHDKTIENLEGKLREKTITMEKITKEIRTEMQRMREDISIELNKARGIRESLQKIYPFFSQYFLIGTKWNCTNVPDVGHRDGPHVATCGDCELVRGDNNAFCVYNRND